MALYTSAEVEKLLGVKSSLLRYWVDAMPLIQPRKDHFGKKLYSVRDLHLLIRLKYLLYTRRLTLEGARAQIENELSCGEAQDLRAEVAALRSALLDSWRSIHTQEPARGDPESNTL
ncbi:MAG: MerR family transcriptional regulator [Treponema sp.]|jgi:DNA-binding transcriptional MerR regulator|nr:MerR family transcriptional regulator [Treponema sp.]